jgi:hypothetical protein
MDLLTENQKTRIAELCKSGDSMRINCSAEVSSRTAAVTRAFPDRVAQARRSGTR